MNFPNKHKLVKLFQTQPIVFVLVAIVIHALIALAVWRQISLSSITVADISLKWHLVGIISVLLLFNLLATSIMLFLQRGREQEDRN